MHDPTDAQVVLSARAGDADAYDQETRLLAEGMERAPYCEESSARRMTMADHKLRQVLADNIRKAKACDQRAVEQLERVLDQESPT